MIQDVSTEHGCHNSVVKKIIDGGFVCMSEVMPDYAELLQNFAIQAASGSSRTANLQRAIPSCAADFALCLRNLSSAIVTYYPGLRSAWNLYSRFLMDLLKIISSAGVFQFDRMHRLDPPRSNPQIPPGAVAPYPINSFEFPGMLSLFLRTQLSKTAMVPLCPTCAGPICNQTRCNFQVKLAHQTSSSSSTSTTRSRSRSSNPTTVRVCFNWNENESCRSTPCQFSHQCRTCHSVNHKQIACPTRQDASPQRQGDRGYVQPRRPHSNREEKGSPRNNRGGHSNNRGGHSGQRR